MNLHFAMHFAMQNAKKTATMEAHPPIVLEFAAQRLMKAANVRGLALLLIEKGEVSLVKVYGMADVSEQRPLQPDTVMYGA